MTDVPTLSGNEITDAVRRNNTQGDGLLPEQGSTGIWEATTNLVTNGGFETNTTGWSEESAAAGFTRQAGGGKFGSAFGRINNVSNDHGVRMTVTVSLSTTYTASVWLRGVSGVQIKIRLFAPTAAVLLGQINPGILTGGWQRFTLTVTSHSSDPEIRFQIEPTGSATFDFDGVQLEQQPLATPYVETNGASATRAACRARGPSSVVSTAQAWCAFRLRMGWASASPPDANERLFNWGTYGGNFLCLLNESGSWKLLRHTTVDTNRCTKAATFGAGAITTVIGTWTAAGASLSVDGSVFTFVANADVPTISAAFDIGSDAGTGLHIDSEVFWMTTGTGTLTDADARLIASFNNSPSITDFPGTPTWFWDSGPDGTQVPLVVGQLGTGRI